jgi:hypothetical protein
LERRFPRSGTGRNPVRHGLVVTGTYVDGDDPNVVIVVMDMESIGPAK